MQHRDKDAAGASMTRRTLVIGAAALAAALAGCAQKGAVETSEEANARLCAETDAGSVRLPLGSVVETGFGRWMIAGHNPTALSDGDPEKRLAYDYYGLCWPRGVDFPGSEVMDCALFNKADISSVRHVGRVDDEDKVFRAYADAFDFGSYSSEVAFDGPVGPASDIAKTGLEQQMRLQGKLSNELYGDNFDGGLLYEGISPSTGDEGE